MSPIKRVAIAAIVMLYVGSYFILSRVGTADARQHGLDGFYFFSPTFEPISTPINAVCRTVYYPLSEIERAVGTGERPIQAIPLYESVSLNC